ncbi:malate:quinone oxidoreductase [Escherichia coli]|uniref:Malate:quinone oxidoreductase n=1 Tax=Escherichia coli TaxID=562 RepID=A0A376SA06_ECOLX|nr:malate:quinone oxidoreductase [Escherichia coli]
MASGAARTDLSSVMPRKVAYCVWVPKWSATSKGLLPRCWGHRQVRQPPRRIMLNLLEKVFGDRVSSPQWQATLKAIVPFLWTQAER